MKSNPKPLRNIDRIIRLISKTPASAFVDPRTKRVLLEYWRLQRKKILLKKVKVYEDGMITLFKNAEKTAKEEKLIKKLVQLKKKVFPLSILNWLSLSRN